jgi:hypothetical protein
MKATAGQVQFESGIRLHLAKLQHLAITANLILYAARAMAKPQEIIRFYIY